MGYDAGFDLFPCLTDSPEDKASWTRFLRTIQEAYATDPQVVSKVGYYEFIVGEVPRLPRDGTKFLTFSSKVSGHLTACAEPYVRRVYELAREEFGRRVRFWHELREDGSCYSWKEINASQKEYGSSEDGEWSDDPILNSLNEMAGPPLTRKEYADRRTMDSGNVI